MKKPIRKTKTVKSGKFAIETLELELADCPSEFDGYLIAQLSDLHFGPCTSLEHIQAGLQIVREANPDLILLTGDYLQYSNTGLHHILATRVSPKVFRWRKYRRTVSKLAKVLGKELSTLQPRDGFIGIFGNHDYHEGIGSIRRQFSSDIKWLVNDVTAIERSNSRILIAGLDDMREGKPDLKKTHEKLLDYPSSCSRILLSHTPDVSVIEGEALLDDFDLILSGHTHGGQLCLPGGFPIVTRSAQRNHASGLSMHRETPMYVNRGMGYGGLPLRTFCPPEITLLRLTPQQQP